MKTSRICSLTVGMAMAWAGATAHAALMGLSTPSDSPYYADFTLNGLSFQNSYNAVSGVATFTITSLVQNEKYTSSASSPGTLGATTLGPNGNNTFGGSFSLTAYIQQDVNNNNMWTLQPGGVFSVKGNLLGGTTGDLLLAGTLKPGVSGPNGTFGYRTASSGADSAKKFEFLYDVNTTQNAGNGNNTVLQDWATGNPLGSVVTGGMIFTIPGNLNQSLPPFGAWIGDWSKNFTATGVGDVFVPEPATYAWLGSGVAILAFLGGRRKTAKVTGVN